MSKWQVVPSTQYPALEAILNAKPASTIGVGPPTGSGTGGFDFYTDISTGDFYSYIGSGVWSKINPPTTLSTTYNFQSQTPGGSLSVGGNSITLSPVPLGINHNDVGHYIYLSGGTGTAEAVLITGGDAVSGATNGVITFTCLHTHSGAWTVASATGGIQEAIEIAKDTGGRNVYVNTDVLTVIHAPIYIPIEMSGGVITGNNAINAIQAASDFLGASMLIGEGTTVGVITLDNLTFDANNISTITTVIQLARTENALRTLVRRVSVYNSASNTTMINMDGHEDANIEDCSFYAQVGATGVVSIACHVPFGNIHIRGCSTAYPMYLSGQIVDITGCTTGSIVADGFIETYSFMGVYVYPDPSLKAHFYTNGVSSSFGSGVIVGYLVPEYVGSITSGIVALRGQFSGKMDFWGIVYSIPSVVSSATTALSGTKPVIVLHNTVNAISGVVGTPGANVSILPESPGPGATLTLVNGDNNNIVIGANRYLRVVGPTGAFAITGFVWTGGTDWGPLVIYNGTGQVMTIKHGSGSSSAGNRIFTATSANITSSWICQFIYDITASGFLMQSPIV